MAKTKAIRFQLPKAKLLQFNRQGKAIAMQETETDAIDRHFAWILNFVSEAAWREIKPFAEPIYRAQVAVR